QCASQIALLLLWVLLPVNHSLRECVPDKRFQRTSQSVVFRSKHASMAIPHPNGVATDISERPSFARFHARLMERVAEHVEAMAHDEPSALVVVLNDGVTNLPTVS